MAFASAGLIAVNDRGGEVPVPYYPPMPETYVETAATTMPTAVS